ncbi:P-loop containing nucleoside triphosphate hydrolase protein, partial [Calycina marina]
MFGDRAEFRGLQEPALRAIMKGKSPILVIMGTGAGKSLLFMLPAKCVSNGTTIVITPLVSLQNDLVERCQKTGISCMMWDSRKAKTQAHSPTRVVMVTPESAVSKTFSTTFSTFLTRLQGMHQLDRIIVDECHTVLDSTPKFRPKMRQLGDLVRREVQMVYLTATLPPHTEPEFMEIMKVKAEDVHIFRAVTSRPNIQYLAWEYEGEEEAAICQLVKDKLDEFPASAKIIIYSSSIASTKALSKALQCHAYYREIGSAQKKEEIRKEWQSANGRVIIATNAFGLGIDQPDVRCVIHVGPIYQIRSYGQESGRAGRDGERCQAIIVMPKGKQEALQKAQRHPRNQTIDRIAGKVVSETQRRKIEIQKVNRLISGARCRRIYLDEELDGRIDRLRCEEGDEVCDICQED